MSSKVYIPTLYLLASSACIVIPWHMQSYEPFAILTVFWLNTMLFTYWKHREQMMCGIVETNVSVVHQQNVAQIQLTAWQSVVLGVFGILFNAVYEKLFEQYLITNQTYSLQLSVAYALVHCVVLVRYVSSHKAWIMLHSAALYAPMAREFWTANVTLYVCVLVMLTYSTIANMHLEDTIMRKIPTRPAMESFVYLRVHWQVGVGLAVVHILLSKRSGRGIMTIEEHRELHRKIDDHLARRKKKVGGSTHSTDLAAAT